MVTASQPWSAISSAENAARHEHQPPMAGLPAAQISRRRLARINSFPLFARATVGRRQAESIRKGAHAESEGGPCGLAPGGSFPLARKANKLRLIEGLKAKFEAE